MKGNNEMGINTATMILIVQHYFDTVLFAKGQAPKVNGIAYNSGNFKASLTDAPEVPNA